MIKVHFHFSVHTYRSDNAFELGNNSEATAFLTNDGILHQTAISHTTK